MMQLQLPYHFKKIGIGIAIMSFILLLANKFAIEMEAVRTFGKYGMLIGMLLISISREKIEDELVTKLRMQSFAFAFIFGVMYALALPILDYALDYSFKDGEAIFKGMGDFSILWILLCIQVFYFEYLKRMHR